MVGPTLILIILVGVAALVAAFVVPLAVAAWSVRRTGRMLLVEVAAFLGDGQMVVRVATGRAKRPAWQTATAARIERTQWTPRRSFGAVSQAIGVEVVVIDTFGQRSMLPTG